MEVRDLRSEFDANLKLVEFDSVPAWMMPAPERSFRVFDVQLGAAVGDVFAVRHLAENDADKRNRKAGSFRFTVRTI